MSDLLVELSAKPWFRKGVKNLGLPLPTPQMLRRPKGPVSATPLADRHVAVGLGPRAALTAQLGGTLARAGAQPTVVAEELPEIFTEAGQAFGRPAQLIAPGEAAPEGSKMHALVFDATGLEDPADLDALYRFFHPWIGQLNRNGRVLVLGRPADEAKSAPAAAARAALEGFIRSLAKEIGRIGATAHVAFVEEGAEAHVPGLLRFLLSDRSAFLTGQPWRLSAKLPAVSPEGDGTRPLAGRTLVLTGAARGIGAATAKILAAEGAHVLGIDRPGDEGPLAQVMAQVGGTPLSLDITDEGAPAQLRAFIAERFGQVHGVIHNAGITRDKTLKRMKPEQWAAAIAVNLKAIVALDEALLQPGEGGLADGGAIVCLSSVSGLAGNVGQTNYSASKAGVSGYVKAQGPLLAKRRIAVSAVAPGFIETRLTAAIPAVTREVGRRLSALGQGGQPRDVGELLCWLSQPEAAGLSGQTLRACGGMFLGA